VTANSGYWVFARLFAPDTSNPTLAQLPEKEAEAIAASGWRQGENLGPREGACKMAIGRLVHGG